jgi:hypothetical protein
MGDLSRGGRAGWGGWEFPATAQSNKRLKKTVFIFVSIDD